ncbi:TetR/AcrR family transcriptional regulator [Robbsia sp. Bb-Pol-6]|uniref:TetR/AcrR family transcriptional regulator n=1 Tax=Robbsia betulipollinis TaxID=2981849 RepID=A0ABT3ZIH8_9BURK|nr:TetR/AcrR family transcriptional regulator [Robbsia betulipollinis]MCY0385788.1 TetR/AcrR family transcriptional regulator [Robbsia betulipollinis]
METEAPTNKQGQILGRKGRETRARLMEATRLLLRTCSPVELTAVGIAAEAGTSPASFYMYFDDPKDVLFALGEEAGRDLAKLRKIFEEPWYRDKLERQAGAMIEGLNAVWARHRPALRFRNTEASRGDKRFEALRMNTFTPFIRDFAECILSVNPARGARKRADAFAEASILHGAMEHLAATSPDATDRYLGAKHVNRQLARIMALVIRGEAEADALGREAPADETIKPARVATRRLRASVANGTASPAMESAIKPLRKARPQRNVSPAG